MQELAAGRIVLGDGSIELLKLRLQVLIHEQQRLQGAAQVTIATRHDLVDGRIGYAGSQNIVAKDFRPGILNKELVVRVEGPAVAAMGSVFQSDWFLETEELLDDPPLPEP